MEQLTPGIYGTAYYVIPLTTEFGAPGKDLGLS
jgi:hypothetical protein